MRELQNAVAAVLSGDYGRMYETIRNMGLVPDVSPEDCEWEGGDLCGYEDVENKRSDMRFQLLKAGLAASEK